MKRKRLILWTLSVLLFVSLFSCGAKSGGEEDTEKESVYEGNAAVEEKIRTVKTSESAYKVISEYEVDLNELIWTGGPPVPIVGGKFIYPERPAGSSFYNDFVLKEGLGEPFFIDKAFDLPVQIELELDIVKLPGQSGNFAVNYGNTRLVNFYFMEEGAEDGLARVFFNDPTVTQQLMRDAFPLRADEVESVVVVIDKNYVEVIINGDIIITESGLNYVKSYEENPDYKIELPFAIDLGWYLEVALKSIKICELLKMEGE